MVGFLPAVVVHDRLVADQRQGEATHASVAGDDDLVDGAHPCRRFRGGSERLLLDDCLHMLQYKQLQVIEKGANAKKDWGFIIITLPWVQ